MLVGHRHRSSPPIDAYRACELCGAVLDPNHLEQTADGPVCLFCGRVAPTLPERSARRDAIAVGDVLRDARVQRGISLEHAAAETCIRTPYLQDLEDDASPSEYPGRVYSRFFLSEYAEYLGLDRRPLLAEFDRALAEEPIQPDTPPSSAPVHRGRMSWSAAAIVSAAVLVVALFVTRPSARPDVTVRSSAIGGHDVGAAAAKETKTPPATAPLRPDGDVTSANRDRRARILAILTASTAISVEPVIDGAPRRSVEVHRRQAIRFRAHRSLDLTLERGRRAVLKVNGRRVEVGARRHDRHLSFVLRHGTVVRRR